MQQIERVGVVALLFLIVTIVVVAFWDDGKPVESTRVADRDARREQSSAEARVRADERGLRDDGRIAARQGRDRLTAPVGGSDDGIPRTRTQPDTNRANRIPRNADARQARNQERARNERAAQESVDLEFPRGPSQAEAERMVQRGYYNAPDDRAPQSRVIEPASVQRPESASRKVKQQTAPAVDSSAGGVWVVKSGESLERIARRALGDGKRWPEIAALNGIDNPNKIIVGQELQLPGGAAAPERVASSTPPPADRQAAAPPAAGGEYVVQKGDMLSVIAQQRLGSAKRWREIAALNPKVDPDRLLVGTRLVMPVGATAPAPPVESRHVAQAGDSGYRVR